MTHQLGAQFSKRRGAPCRDCGTTLRTKNDRAADNPGTRVHASAGICSTCYNRRKSHGVPIRDETPQPPSPPKPVIIHGLDSADERERVNAQRAQEWLTERRNRGVPTGGLWAA